MIKEWQWGKAWFDLALLAPWYLDPVGDIANRVEFSICVSEPWGVMLEITLMGMTFIYVNARAFDR